MTTFSIIIVTYNSAETIVACLKSISSNITDGPVFEIILIDNASTDATRQIIRTQFPDVILIENKKNTGFATAVNQGAESSKGKYLLFFNPDAVASEKFLRRLFEYLQSDSQASIVGVNLVDTNGKHQPSCWKTPGLFTLLPEMFLPYKLSLEFVTDNPTLRTEVKMVSGACMVIRREVFDRLHGFDTEYFMYYEDADICFRARKEGYKVFFNPEINVLHYIRGSRTDEQLFYEQFYNSKLLFFKKHFSPVFSVMAHLLVFLGIFVRIPAYEAVGAITFNKKLLRLAKVHTLLLRNIFFK
jgi:GT2 family glycosyltransferase